MMDDLLRFLRARLASDELEWTEEPYVLALFTLRMCTLPYADHPDYREEWKP